MGNKYEKEVEKQEKMESFLQQLTNKIKMERFLYSFGNSRFQECLKKANGEPHIKHR